MDDLLIELICGQSLQRSAGGPPLTSPPGETTLLAVTIQYLSWVCAMPISSPSSRVVLGAVLGVAVVLMVVVACSRPSSSEPDTRLIRAPSDNAPSTRDNAPSDNETVVATPPRQSALGQADPSPLVVQQEAPADVPQPEGAPAEPRQEIESDQRAVPGSGSAEHDDPPAMEQQPVAIANDLPVEGQPPAAAPRAEALEVSPLAPASAAPNVRRRGIPADESSRKAIERSGRETGRATRAVTASVAGICPSASRQARRPRGGHNHLAASVGGVTNRRWS